MTSLSWLGLLLLAGLVCSSGHVVSHVETFHGSVLFPSTGHEENTTASASLSWNVTLVSLVLNAGVALQHFAGHVRTYVSDVLSIECGSFVFRSLCLHQDAAPLCAERDVGEARFLALLQAIEDAALRFTDITHMHFFTPQLRPFHSSLLSRFAVRMAGSSRSRRLLVALPLSARAKLAAKTHPLSLSPPAECTVRLKGPAQQAVFPLRRLAVALPPLPPLSSHTQSMQFSLSSCVVFPPTVWMASARSVPPAHGPSRRVLSAALPWEPDLAPSEQFPRAVSFLQVEAFHRFIGVVMKVLLAPIFELLQEILEREEELDADQQMTAKVDAETPIQVIELLLNRFPKETANLLADAITMVARGLREGANMGDGESTEADLSSAALSAYTQWHKKTAGVKTQIHDAKTNTSQQYLIIALTNRLAPTITDLVVETVVPQLQKELTPLLREKLVPAINERVGRPLKRSLPVLLTRTLSQAVPHAVLPAVFATLTSSTPQCYYTTNGLFTFAPPPPANVNPAQKGGVPVPPSTPSPLPAPSNTPANQPPPPRTTLLRSIQDGMAGAQADPYHSPSCLKCMSSPVPLYYQIYYATYFADYFAGYYSEYFTAAADLAEAATEGEEPQGQSQTPKLGA